MKKRIFAITISFAVLLVMLNCTGKPKDDFYSNSCGWDCRRIPLLKPFYLSSTTGIDGQWVLSGPLPVSGRDVLFVNVIDTIVISYYFDKYIVVPEKRDTTWYIHIPGTKDEYIFKSEDKFVEAVQKLSKKRIEFFEVSSLYRRFIKDGYLEWFPEDFKK